jgi:hypothetical protein
MGLGAVSFKRRPEKKFYNTPKPFKVPEGYEFSLIEKGYNAIMNTKVKGKVTIGNQVPRDNSMYS